MAVLWFLTAVASAAAAAFFARNHARRIWERKAHYVQRLEESQTYLQRQISRLDALVGMLSEIYKQGMRGIGPASREEICQSVLKNACRILQARQGSLLLLDPEKQILSIAAAQGLPSGAENLRLKLGEGVSGRVAQTGRPIYVEDIRTDRRFLRSVQSPLESRVMASVPLCAKDRVVGVLNVNSEGEESFEERDTRLLEILADQGALTLENFELCESLRRFNIEMVQTLLQAIDAKDVQRRRHTGRLRHLARGVARELNLPEALTQFVEYAVLMREIGKIGIEDDILRKPGKLTAAEYEAVKKHPEIGSKILSPVEFLAPVAPMILYHQEWYNGQGYPEGLSGEEIPLGARIVAVLGAWEAMTSDKPYRRALERDAAVRELSDGAGKQFDPRVVDAFLRFLEKEDRSAAPPLPA